MKLERLAWYFSSAVVVAGLSFGAQADDKAKPEDKKPEVKKDEKKAEAKPEAKKEEKKVVVTPDAVLKAFEARFKGFKVVESKAKKENFQVKAANEAGKKFEAVLSADGKVVECDEYEVKSNEAPAAVLAAVKKWAPEAQLAETVKVETEDGKTVYEFVAMQAGKKLKAEVAEDGTVLESDKLPEVKKEEPKKEEPKKEEPKKDEKKAAKDEVVQRSEVIRKEEPKTEAKPAAEPKKEEPKKAEPKKEEAKKAEPKKDEKAAEPKKEKAKKADPKKDEKAAEKKDERLPNRSKPLLARLIEEKSRPAKAGSFLFAQLCVIRMRTA